MHNIRVIAKLDNVTYQAKSKDRFRGMKKGRKALKRLGLIVQPNGNSLIVQSN